MSAALRYAARTAVGGRALQQLQRLMHSGTSPSFPRVYTFATATRSNTKGLASESEGRIKKMKEELYTAISEHEKDNAIYDVFVSPNARLLECLSVELDPKHNDPRWHSHRRKKRIGDWLRLAGVFFLTTTTMKTLFGSMGADPEGRATKRDLA